MLRVYKLLDFIVFFVLNAFIAIQIQNFMNKSYPFYRVNAFTNYHFSGNPASVVLLEEAFETNETYANIAAEMSTPETAFILPTSNPYSHEKVFSLRFFMVTHEVKMCGHATLAAAHVLLKELGDIHSSIVFTTQSGNITATELENGKIALDFPADNFDKFVPSNEFLQKIGLTNYVTAAYADSRNLAIIEVENLSTLQNLVMDFELLKNHKELNIKKLALTTNNLDVPIKINNNSNNIEKQIEKNTQNYDFVSRCFCPWIGINEDALSAASHTVLAKFWATKIPKTHFKAFQASKRQGELEIVIKPNQRMDLIGEGFLSLKGEIML